MSQIHILDQNMSDSLVVPVYYHVSCFIVPSLIVYLTDKFSLSSIMRGVLPLPFSSVCASLLHSSYVIAVIIVPLETLIQCFLAAWDLTASIIRTASRSMTFC